jgi:hypothetical protein
MFASPGEPRSNIGYAIEIDPLAIACCVTGNLLSDRLS